ncbi:hypothetical protein COCON_G00067690 [Conger conger]|uniref:Uncharacterized protein n=1 Tax=Conger conger TaxID=82655 RepID=A0A9Q1DSN6_CONCO|nr:hypothetical protein COCON_G00067690 [Conger conger]
MKVCPCRGLFKRSMFLLSINTKESPGGLFFCIYRTRLLLVVSDQSVSVFGYTIIQAVVKGYSFAHRSRYRIETLQDVNRGENQEIASPL